MVGCRLKQVAGLTFDQIINQPKYLGDMLIPGGAQMFRLQYMITTCPYMVFNELLLMLSSCGLKYVVYILLNRYVLLV